MTRATIWAGLLLGLLYLVEAVISTGAFFLLWPILGGLFAAGLAKRTEPSFSVADGARSGFAAALIGAAILLVVGTPLTHFLLERLGEQPGFFGRRLELGPIASLLVMFGGYALLGLVVASIAGALVGLLAGRGQRRAN